MDTTCYFISIDLSLTRDSAESQFYALTTNNYPMKPLCRRYLIPSQQLCKEYSLFFGMSRKSPYLCIGFKIHT